MSDKSLSSLVRIYQRTHGPRLVTYLDYFKKLKSFEEAIQFACHGKDGEIHPHQHRVGSAKLEQANKLLQKRSAEIMACKSFEELLNVIENCTSEIDRFGNLAVYDTSLRLGAHLGFWPEVVYLHAGTRKGCRALGLVTSNATVEMEKLPKHVRVLEPYQAEDFLCIFKDRFGLLGEGDSSPEPVAGCVPQH